MHLNSWQPLCCRRQNAINIVRVSQTALSLKCMEHRIAVENSSPDVALMTACSESYVRGHISGYIQIQTEITIQARIVSHVNIMKKSLCPGECSKSNACSEEKCWLICRSIVSRLVTRPWNTKECRRNTLNGIPFHQLEQI